MEAHLEERLVAQMADVPDFPKPGVVFKDLGPVWRDPALCRDLVASMARHGTALSVDAIVGIESRGFLLGMPLALALDVPFVLARKAGKLPGAVHAVSYGLEYGEAVLEMQANALQPGQRVLVHDDVLATGGTAAACRQLVEAAGAEVVGWSFLVELAFLNGRAQLAAGDASAIWRAHSC